MGRLFTVSLEGKIYNCKYCGTHLALHENIVSRSFIARRGEACIFNKVVNVTRGKLLDSTRLRGLRAAAVIFCVGCGAMMGLTTGCVHENNQKYEEGKSVLERLKLSFQGPDGWSPA